MPKIVDHKARRKELCEVAAGLIATRGLEAATTREIARASGYSKGVVEHYFDSKAELISAALDWANDNYQRRAQRRTKGLAGLAALRARLQATVPLTAAVRDEWKIRMLVWSMASIDKDLKKQQALRHKSAVEQFAADIEAAAELGEIMSANAALMHARRVVLSASGLSCAALHNQRVYNKAMLENEIRYIIARLRSDAI